MGTAVVPSGPAMVTAVGPGVTVTFGGILIGSRPMMDMLLPRRAVVLKERERLAMGARCSMAGTTWRHNGQMPKKVGLML